MRKNARNVRLVLLSLLLLIFFSCYRLNYKFVEDIDEKQRAEFFEKVKGNRLFGDIGVLEGIFIEMGKTYNFKLYYDLNSSNMELKFFSAISDELVFDAVYEDGDMTYNYFQNSFFTVKIGLFLKYFNYILNVTAQNAELKLTNDDYYVAIDERGNYYKYDETRLIKKENRRYLIRYIYNEEFLDTIEINSNNKKYFIKFMDKEDR